MRFSTRFLATLGLTLALLPAAAVRAAEPVTAGEVTRLHSAVLGEERALMVFLPRGYQQGEGEYPVLYLLDSEGRFLHTVGTVDTLARNGEIPEMIVVGLTNTQRTRDLTPRWTHPDPPEDRARDIAIGGGADDFVRFFRDELIPHVERTYRTAPFRILVGHSFGGLFAVHALVTEPELFDAILAISPSLWWDEGESVTQAAALFAARPELRGHLYLTLADEGGDMHEKFHEMTTLLRYRAPAGLRWHAEVMDGENHGSIPVPSVHDSLRWFFPRWNVPPFVFAEGLEAIDRHYAELAAEYGLEVKTPEALINNLGYQAIFEQDLDKAIALLRANVERYPHSANVYDSLGEALEAAGELAQARDLYARAYELGQGDDDPNLAAYKQHLDAVTAKLASNG